MGRYPQSFYLPQWNENRVLKTGNVYMGWNEHCRRTTATQRLFQNRFMFSFVIWKEKCIMKLLNQHRCYHTHTHTQCPTVILVQMKVNVMIYVLCTSQAWLLFCLNCTEIMVKGWICALNVMPSNIHTLCCYPFTHCLKICLIFLRENRQDWPCTCFFVCIGTSSCLCECLQPSVCQLLLLISAGEVASVLSSDKALTLRVKECEPGAVTIKTFPWGGQCWTPQQTG